MVKLLTLAIPLMACATEAPPDTSTKEQETFSCPFFCDDNTDCQTQCGLAYTCDKLHGGTNRHPCNLVKVP